MRQGEEIFNQLRDRFQEQIGRKELHALERNLVHIPHSGAPGAGTTLKAAQ